MTMEDVWLEAEKMAEESLIGGMLLSSLDAPSEVFDVSPEDFTSSLNAAVWEAIRAVTERGESASLVAIAQEAKTWEYVPPKFLSYASSLEAESVTSANLQYWAETVRRNARYRHARRRIASALKSSVHQGSAEALSAEVLESVRGIPAGTQELTPLRDLLREEFRNLEERYRNRGSALGVQTGFEDLDSILTGMAPGDLVILAGRPSMGKTAMGLQIAEQSSGDDTTLIVSAEMSKSQLVQRMLASCGGVDLHRLRSMLMLDSDWPKLTVAADRLSRASIEITDQITDLKALKAAMRRYATRKLKLVVIDYLQLLRASGRSREEEVSSISRDLKSMAKEHNCPILALAQLNRGVEGRTDKRPLLSDLRESGSIEQDADIVMMLYRDDYYNQNTDSPGVTEVLVRKNRNGQTGQCELSWNAPMTRFGRMKA